MTPGRAEEIYVLDIDGTLMHTHEIDNDCYWEAVHEVFEMGQGAGKLDEFEHVSDSGILREWCQRYLGRDAEESEIRHVRELFLGLMESVSREQPELFAPRTGLEPWLEGMNGRSGTHLAIATGSWGNTAQFKLEFSGLSRFGLAVASADDAISRAGIMNVAVSRLDLSRPVEDYHITYIGDGPWDFAASQELGWSFIGIAEGDRARTLFDLGAERVEADFEPLARHHAFQAR
ncbi:MAG: HAD hydrolase-like protein [Xanthomonadales bacterium]|nr:HAD hydrolase-like protein [Xanthomonadales bacterium]NIX12028.1 HAD hydrolase-like protein [Xanthomonadales bacterium]